MKPFQIDEQNKIKSGFTVPEGFFEANAQNLLNQIDDTPAPISLWDRYKKPLMSIAAILVIGLGIGFYWKIQVQNDEEAHWAAVESYVAEHTDLTDEAYIDYLNTTALDTLHQNTTEAKILEEVLIENGDLEQYITE